MTQNSTLTDRHYREEICELIQIKKDTYYKRVKFLGLEAHRDEDKRTYLDDEQFQLMCDLDSHVANTGKMEGFTSTKSDESRALTTMESKGIATNDQSAPLATEEIYVEPEEPTANMDVDGLVRGAKELAAQNMAMGNLVKLSLAQQMSFDDLDPDLQEKVNAANEAANPKHQPASIASQLLAQYRSNRSGKP